MRKFLTGAGVLDDILDGPQIHICSAEAKFKIWLKSVEYDGITNNIKDG